VTLAAAGRAFAAALAIFGCTPQRGTIGAVLAQGTDQRLYVREVPADLAAARSGVQIGDEILLIDGTDARALGTRGVHEALSGNVGDPVKLTLIREGRVVRVTLKRTPARRHQVPKPG
jgi:C-terminal processing protease CtpA/Prc